MRNVLKTSARLKDQHSYDHGNDAEVCYQGHDQSITGVKSIHDQRLDEPNFS